MSSQTGRMLRLQLFGESHGDAVGVVMDGLPAGLRLDMDRLRAQLMRRAARGELATDRRESDQPRIVSGLMDGATTGQPLCALFANEDARGADYAFLPDMPRPGHADYPATVKSAGFDDLRGGGHHSGRLTLPYVFAGAVAAQLMRSIGVRVAARVKQIGDVLDEPLDPIAPDMDALERAGARQIATLSEAAGERMAQVIRDARQAGDSVGGVVEVMATGAPVGLGAPYFDGFESVAAAQLFAIPAVKGVDFGAGFGAAALRGSAYNDPYRVRVGRVVTERNSSGGLVGGLTNGMPIVARVAFRPTASITVAQDTVSLSERRDARLTLGGRHDPCVALRAVPVVESALAIALAELWLRRRGDRPMGEC